MQALFDPFTGFSLVPSQDDWLGLTGRIQNSQPQHGSVQLDIGSGALIADADGKSWVLLRARTTGNAFDMNLPLQVADLLQHSREQAAQADVQLLAASGLLYAANGQRQATREMTWVGGGATAGHSVAAVAGLPPLACVAGVCSGAGGHAVRRGGLRGAVRPHACDDAGAGLQPDRRRCRLPAALPVQELEPETLAQLAGVAPDPAGPDA